MSLLQADSEVCGFDDSCCAAMASACSAKEDSLGASSTNVAGNQSNSYSEETQGYDVDFDPPLESKYECPICLMALREPVQTPCGHRFCKECILKSIRDAGHKCPVDNEMLLESSLFPDNFAKREILSLTVKCPNEGCQQKMELRRLEAHQLVCDFACLECLQCQQTIRKNSLEAHLVSECPRRQVSCKNCLRSLPYDEKKEHDQNCPLAYVTCEYCSIELIREQIPGHYATECPLAPINCSFSPFGCTVKMQRNEEAHHLQDYTQFHMRMMAKALQDASFPGMSHSMMPVPLFETLRLETGSSVSNPLLASAATSPRDCMPEVRNLWETIQQLEGRLVRQDHQIRELIAKMETQSTLVTDMKRTIRGLEDKVAEVEAQQCNGIFVWKIEHFGVYLKDQEDERPVVIHSPGFYTGKPGYKLCLRLHLQLPNAQRCANYLSLFVHTMQGEYDSHLPWPFQGTIRLSVLDQSDTPMRKNLEEVMDTKPELQAFHRPTTHRNPKGFGYVTFMPLHVLKNRTYVKDDTLLVRCEVMPHHDMNSLRREGLQARSTDGAS